MVITIHCTNPRCEAYKKPVKYTFVYLRRSKACAVCGSLMEDGVSKPWGDSYRYDFIVDWEGRLSRTQVRSTEYRSGLKGYAVHASFFSGREAVPLTAKHVDVLVAFISTRNIWYVLPVTAFSPRVNLCFYPDGSMKGALFEEYREAWWVMMGGK